MEEQKMELKRYRFAENFHRKCIFFRGLLYTERK